MTDNEQPKQRINPRIYGWLSDIMTWVGVLFLGVILGSAITQSIAIKDRDLLVSSYTQTIATKDQLIESLSVTTVKAADVALNQSTTEVTKALDTMSERDKTLRDIEKRIETKQRQDAAKKAAEERKLRGLK
ncbi:hypothetical protein [Xanthomonas phage X1]|nr:hypothetical protein [Xanthomonas phage X1]